MEEFSAPCACHLIARDHFMHLFVNQTEIQEKHLGRKQLEHLTRTIKNFLIKRQFRL